MNSWHVGFALLVLGVAIPVGYGLYEFVLTPVPWYWRLTILCILAGCLVLLASAIRDRLQMPTPKEKV
jgi:membrane protein implicated in regulation of membrane protease activity